MHRLYKGLSATLAALVGAGCPIVAEYGMPHATFDLDGTVVDATTDQPIEGIEVAFQGETAVTGADGTWSMHHEYAMACEPCDYHGTDVDGETHGVFAEGVSSFNPTQIEDGDGDWYEGAYEAKDLRLQMPPAAE